MEDLINSIREKEILKKLIPNNSNKNVIIENVNGEQCAVNITINGYKKFHKKSELQSQPVNFERITFLIENEEVEFVRC